MNNTKYHGKANYETWNVGLWITNDEYVYRALLRRRDEFNELGTVENVRRAVCAYYPMGTPDFDDVRDYDKVDWNEIKELVDEM